MDLPLIKLGNLLEHILPVKTDKEFKWVRKWVKALEKKIPLRNCLLSFIIKSRI